MVTVVGGYYREHCRWPRLDEAFGSGGRAAIALSLAGDDVEWHYYCPVDKVDDIKHILGNPHLVHKPTHMVDGARTVNFDYFHPLSQPVFWPDEQPRQPEISVEGKAILRFGMMEGDGAVVKGNRVVFDPQSPRKPVSFKANGSSADVLAIVLNAQEVSRLGGSDDEVQAVANIRAAESAAVVIVKAGPHGCRIYDEAKPPVSVPVYRTERVYKIGSGDVFSAAFTHHWAVRGRPPSEAADIASRCVARYCETRLPSVVEDETTANYRPIKIGNPNGQVYIAAPFFTMSELWLVEQACIAFSDMGINFFSPFHEAGMLGEHIDDDARESDINRIVSADIEGLAKSSAVLAIIDGCDPGTIFEVGWAAKHGIPVIALSQNPKPADLTMIRGSKNCRIVDDFSSAVYLSAWAAWEG